VELPIFLECAREAGLQADDRYHAKFPASELATVSVNLHGAGWRVGTGIDRQRCGFAHLICREIDYLSCAGALQGLQ